MNDASSISALDASVFNLGGSSIVRHRVKLNLGLDSGFHRQSGVMSKILQGFATHLSLSIHVSFEVIANDVCRVFRPSRKGHSVQSRIAHGKIVADSEQVKLSMAQFERPKIIHHNT